MSRQIAISGTGAVSAAGWGVAAMMQTLRSQTQPEAGVLERASAIGKVTTPVMRVPAEGSTCPKFARLRRASPISRFAAAAVAEAMGPDRQRQIAEDGLRVGIVFTLTNGCVNYSNRFFTEAIADASLASPILFPETVFNAPSSHLSAMIGSTAPNDTLITDGAGFFSGIDLAAEWLQRGEVDGCLVVSAEEIDWLSAEGLRLYSRRYLPSEGAAAVYLEIADGPAVLQRLPDPVSLAARGRVEAAAEIRTALDVEDDGNTLLIDGRAGIGRYDWPETSAWSDWQGPRWSPRKFLGEAMGVSSGFQIIAATEAIRVGEFPRVAVTATGANQQAAGLILGQPCWNGCGMDR